MTAASSTFRPAILLLAHGTPGSPDDVPAYMRNITGGRPIPDAVMQEVQHRYALIGTSPLTDITMQQADALSKKLDVPVYVGMRNWHPFIADTVKTMLADGITHTIAICLAPQNSRTSVGLYKKVTTDAAADHMQVTFVDSWHDHPDLIAAFAERLQAALKNAAPGVPIIFTAHSVPCRTICGENIDPYSRQAKHTAELVAQSCGITDTDWHFAFQSQGMSGGPWIGPSVEDTITALKAAGHSSFLMQPIGFVCDHVEVLFDIDIFFKKYGDDRGMALSRAESLNTSPRFITALADLATTALKNINVTAGAPAR
ncbi:MAG: ferrochelatase [Acidobacteriales bacterium]|nr:ferrochelatase [Terriglobales bacterium]